jgi:FG-GAP-like repeat/PASTA domain
VRKLLAVAGLLVLAGSAGASRHGGSSGPSFARTTTYRTGYDAAAALAVGDLNGDAKPDLVSTNASSGRRVSVRFNAGGGRFGTTRAFGTGRGPASVAIGDLDGDGSGDIATANYKADTVSVLLNNGGGRFRAKRDYATGQGPLRIRVADVSGDGKPDLVTANGSGISVLLNLGDGRFQVKRAFGPGLSPIDLAVGDLNADGSADLATVNENQGLSVLLNAGGGSFPARRDYGTVFDPLSIEIGDVNGDGKPDLVTSSSDKEVGPGVSVYLNRGQARFGSWVFYSLHGDWAEGARSPAIGDLTGDGKADVAVTSRLHAVSVLVNRGAGAFRRQLDYRAGPYPASVVLADLNGDRRRDLAIANIGSISVLLNKPSVCDVQDLRRQTLVQAKRTLARVNCRVGKVSYAYSRTIRGLVIRQKPKLGVVLRGGSAVDVVVSRGGRPS